MPEIYQDWEPVILTKNKTKANKTVNLNPKPNDDNDGDIPKKLNTYTKELSILMQNARQNKNLTQTELAKKLNIQTSIINDIECGKAIYNKKTYSTIMRHLGVNVKPLNLPNS